MLACLHALQCSISGYRGSSSPDPGLELGIRMHVGPNFSGKKSIARGHTGMAREEGLARVGFHSVDQGSLSIVHEGTVSPQAVFDEVREHERTEVGLKPEASEYQSVAHEGVLRSLRKQDHSRGTKGRKEHDVRAFGRAFVPSIQGKGLPSGQGGWR